MELAIKNSMSLVAKENTTFEDSDFSAEFIKDVWLVKWKWRDKVGAVLNTKLRKEAIVMDGDLSKFDEEVKLWINEGILVEHDPK